MAALQLRGETYRVIFRYQGHQFAVDLGKVSEREAGQWKIRTEQLLTALDRGTREIPDGCSITDFIYHDGKAPSATPSIGRTTLGQLSEQYLAVMGKGAVEANSLSTIKIHLKHFEKALGKSFLLAGLSLAKLQEYVDGRQGRSVF